MSGDLSDPCGVRDVVTAGSTSSDSAKAGSVNTDEIRHRANITAATAFARAERGRTLHGYAFTFCKAAFLALLFSKYTLLVTSIAAAVLYIAAYRAGVREWSCFVKPPWVVIFFLAVAAIQIYVLFMHGRLPIGHHEAY